MYGEFLEFSGFQVLTAVDGLAGLRLTTEHSPDVIILDMSMPRMKRLGHGAAPTDRAVDLQESIIAVTGHALTGTEAAVKEAGCDVYLTKPLLPERLVEEVWRVLDDMAPRAQTRSGVSE